MKPPLQLLLIEDSDQDAELILRELSRGGWELHFVRVQTAEAVREALSREGWELIISKDAMPGGFTGLEALELAKEGAPGVPFILVSGTIGEEFAVEAMKRGVADYLIKGQLGRLVPSVTSVVAEAAAHVPRERAERELRDSENRLRALIDSALDAVISIGTDGRIIGWNRQAEQMFGWAAREAIGRSMAELIMPARYRDTHALGMRRYLETGVTRVIGKRIEISAIRRDGQEFPIELSIAAIRSAAGVEFSAFVTDITSRKKAEGDLRQNLSLLESTLESTAEGILVVDEGGKIVTTNQRFAQLWGIPADVIESRDDDRAIGFVLDQLVDPESFVARIKELYATPMEESVELIHFNDGRVFTRSSTPRILDGKMVGRVWRFRDITEGQRAERALSESEQRYRNLVDFSPIGIVQVTADGAILAANLSFARLLGYRDPEELIATCSSDDFFFDPEERAFLYEMFEFVTDVEAIMKKKDGGSVAVQLSAHVLRDEAGALRIVECFVQDVTTRREAEFSLRLSEERFRSIIEGTTDIILIVTPQGVIKYHSPSFERVLGYAPDRIDGLRCFDFVHSDDYESVAETLANARQAPGPTGEIRMRHHDGSWRTMQAVVNDLTGTVAIEGVVVTLRDVTERQLLEGQLEQAKRLTSLGRLAATVAHEFNNVLMGVQPFVDLIGRRATDPEAVLNAAGHIAQSVQRGKRISQEILRYAQPAEPVSAAVELRGWLGRLHAEIEPLLGSRIAFDLQLPAVETFIAADVAQLTQVFLNLALNARDAMPNGGMLTFRAEPLSSWSSFSFAVVRSPDRYVHISVRDTGTGIPAKTLEHIFEPLFTTKKSGTGLGLAVAHQVIQRHGGQIFVESAPGEGATFHIFLPAALQEAPQAEAADAQRAVSFKRLLLVEDELLVAEGIRAVLELDGIDVDIAPTGGAALPALARQMPDAVVLDVGLPDMDGTEVFRLIRERYPQLPIVFSSGDGDEGKLDACLSQPHAGFLLKPYSVYSLLEVLTKAIMA